MQTTTYVEDTSCLSSSSSSSSTSSSASSAASHMYLKRASVSEISSARVVELRNPIRGARQTQTSSCTSINEKYVTKSYIYSEPNEPSNSSLNNSNLFDYVIIVGLQEHKTCSTDQINLYEYFTKMTPTISWKYPEEVSIYLSVCLF